MRTTPSALLPTLLVGLLVGPLAAQEAELGPRIDALFETWDQPRSPGASVAVMRGGELLHSAGYGFAQLEYDFPIEPDTVFHVASVTKQVTAFSVALLVAEGKLSLDDQLRAHVQEVPDFGVPLTLRQVLHHTSGLRDQWECLMISGTRLEDVIKQADLLRLVERQRELNFPPGSRHLYCNTGYTLAAEVVARVSGQSFPDFARERIFEPLGMTATHVHDDHTHVVPKRAYSYSAVEGSFAKRVLSYANAGSTSLFTTAPDAVKWLSNFADGRVGGPEVLALMTEPGRLADGKELGYALGIMKGSRKGWPLLEHGGADAGFRSHVVWYPDAELAIAVLANLDDLGPAARCYDIADLILDGLEPPAAEPKPVEETSPAPVAEEQEPLPEAIELGREVLETYAGFYAMQDGYGLELDRSHKSLYLRVANRPRKKLYAIAPLELRDKKGELRLSLRAGEGGAVAGLTLEVEGGVHRFRRVAAGASTPLELTRYTGRYLCEELDTIYHLEEREGSLVARHLRHGELPLKSSWPGIFFGAQWYFRRLDFSFDDQGRASGFTLDGSRVLGLRFVRLESPAD